MRFQTNLIKIRTADIFQTEVMTALLETDGFSGEISSFFQL